MHVNDHLTLEALQILAKKQADAKLYQRHQAVVLALRGRTAPDIARVLGCTPRAAQKWVTRDNREGADGLHERPRSRRPARISGPERERFRRRVEAGPRPDEGRATFHGHDYRRILRDELGVKLGLQATYDLLHRLGFASLMPRPQHKDADEEPRRISKEVVADQIRAIREAHPGEEARVHFEDEARFGQQGTLAYLLTAVCAATGEAYGLISPTLDVEVVNLFLRQSAEELPAGVHAALIWGGAGYHTSPKLVVPASVSLIRLVPYAPGLNPVENLWHDLRSHYWSLRVYADIEASEEAAMSAWRSVCSVPDRVRSICAAPYIEAA